MKLVAGPDGVDVASPGDPIAGILQGNPTLGEAAEVGVDGESKAVAGAAVAKGALLEVNASGRLITASGTPGRHLVGFCMEAVGADGEIMTALLKDMGAQ